ncbi:hypothetical protein CKO12_00490 [Chromatium okenii]|uniref:hypothetical protein n=1 Tax=Chromatium okenii TaxID=61644 RepID=UPI001903BB53|nr:hypothetical protein [Chromatium okenii]MBK1640384.1 hypothetical protein [Chromatium okenii]
MPVFFTNQRQGYHYRDFLFSQDGKIAKSAGIEYRERPFSAIARRRFHLWLALVLFSTVFGIPLLAAVGLQQWLLWIVMPIIGMAYWLHRRIHACPRCGRASQQLKTPHMGAPVLYLCSRCRTFFAHGEIDGGLPWK